MNPGGGTARRRQFRKEGSQMGNGQGAGVVKNLGDWGVVDKKGRLDHGAFNHRPGGDASPC